MEPKKEETKKKTTPKKTTTTQKKKTTSTAAKKTTSSVKSTATKKSATASKKNTTTKTSTSKTASKKTSTPKTTVSSTKKSTSTTKKSPSKTTTTKKSTPKTTVKKKSTTSKPTPSKTKKSTTSKTAPIKVVQKKEIKTSLDKEIETPREEPIKFITSDEKRKGKKVTPTKKKIDFQTMKEKTKKVGSSIFQIVKQCFLKLVEFFKNLKPIKKEEKSTKKEEKITKVSSEKPKKKKGKWILFLMILFVFILLMLIPYGKDTYLSGASNKNLEAPKLMKLKEECCSYTATFSSPRSIMALKKDMEKIIKEYEVLQCDNKTFYYNASENYTITDYSFKNGIVFNQLSITYGVGNSCDIDTKFKKLEVLPADFSIEDAKKDGNYVVDDGKVYNKDAYINFMEQVNQKIESTLRIVTTNANKDVLITDVTYKDGKYSVSYDGTRDKNAKNNKSIVAYKFEHLIVSNGKLYAYNGDKLVTKKAKKYETYYLLDVE